LPPSPSGRCRVRQNPADPNCWVFDFDPAAPGGRGGASIVLDPATGLASVAGVHRNALLPRRSTGELIADGLSRTPMPRPAVLEAYNVERKTRYNLMNGGSGVGTLLGDMLADTVAALGGTITRWEPVKDGNVYHLRVHADYP
jgi:hypothetical protein